MASACPLEGCGLAGEAGSNAVWLLKVEGRPNQGQAFTGGAAWHGASVAVFRRRAFHTPTARGLFDPRENPDIACSGMVQATSDEGCDRMNWASAYPLGLAAPGRHGDARGGQRRDAAGTDLAGLARLQLRRLLPLALLVLAPTAIAQERADAVTLSPEQKAAVEAGVGIGLANPGAAKFGPLPPARSATRSRSAAGSTARPMRAC